jgi:hypothetical protein
VRASEVPSAGPAASGLSIRSCVINRLHQHGLKTTSTSSTAGSFTGGIYLADLIDSQPSTPAIGPAFANETAFNGGRINLGQGKRLPSAHQPAAGRSRRRKFARQVLIIQALA